MKIINSKHWLSETFPPIAAYVALDIVLTAIFVAISPSGAEIGALRPVAAIPAKIVELVFVGASLGIAASLTFRKIDLNLTLLSLAFVVLLDVDHLPAALGYQEPIRPAHTIAFLLVLLGVLSFTIKKQPEVELIAISAFLAHLAADTGELAIFAPFSFNYSSIDPYRIPIAVCALAFALLAGFIKYIRYKRESRFVKEGIPAK